MNNEKGMTLLELLAAILILGIIAAITVPAFTNQGEKARIQAHETNTNSIESAIDRMSLTEGIVHDAVVSDFGKVDKNHELFKKGYIKEEEIKNPWEGTRASQSGADGNQYYYIVTKDLVGRFYSYLVGHDGTNYKTIVVIENGKAVAKDLNTYTNIKLVTTLSDPAVPEERLVH